MPKTEEGLSYQYEKGVLTFRTCPNPITSLNIAQIDAGGPIREIRVVFGRALFRGAGTGASRDAAGVSEICGGVFES